MADFAERQCGEADVRGAELSGPLRPPHLEADAGPELMAGACLDEEMVRERVVAVHCADSDCHDSERPAANLDLVSGEMGSRILLMRSNHERCLDRPLVEPGNARAAS